MLLCSGLVPKYNDNFGGGFPLATHVKATISFSFIADRESSEAVIEALSTSSEILYDCLS
jgi:hypothetical protein